MKNLFGNALEPICKRAVSILVIFLCLSCSQKAAPALDRSKNTYHKRVAAPTIIKQQDLPSENKILPFEKKLNSHQITVAAGDTLFSLSRKHQVPLRDLIKQNNLEAPYSVKVGTVLTIPTPTYHEVKTGETLYAISRIYNMKIDSLIEMNDLQAPYNVKVGHLIRVEKFGTNNGIATNVIQNKPAAIIAVNDNKKREDKTERKLKNIEEKKLTIPSPKAEISEKTPNKLNHFSWPMRGTIISKFGPKQGGLYNDGVNIKAKEGVAVKSSEDGIVAYVGNELKGYGNLVIIKHSGGWITAYAHLANSSVARGQKVAKGTKIGTVGSSGNVNSPQLYFGLRKGRDAVNPEHYLK